MDTEVIMEDLETMAEEPEITQDPAMVEETKEAFSKTLNNCTITRDSIMWQLGHIARVEEIIMFSPPAPPSEHGS